MGRKLSVPQNGNNIEFIYFFIYLYFKNLIKMTSESDKYDSEKEGKSLNPVSKIDSLKIDSILQKDILYLKDNQLGNHSVSLQRKDNLQRSILKR
jgi:hypothetical protein